MTCDTVVVGAGITGLSIAFNLSQSQRVIILDASRIGDGSSGWNAGILSVDTTIDLREIEAAFGSVEAKSLITLLIATLEQTKTSLGLTNDQWQSGTSLYVAAKSSHQSYLAEELSARTKYSLPTKLLTKKDMDKTWRGFYSALELGNEQAVHSVGLLLAMSERIAQSGSSVFEESRVVSWNHAGDHFAVRCQNGSVIKAQNLVLCSGLGSSEITEANEISKLLVPVVGHVLVTEPSQYFATLARSGGPIALWDSLQLYHYVRYLPDGRILVGGEEGPGVIPAMVLSHSNEHIQRLYRWAQEHHVQELPPIQHCWKASLAVPVEGLPLVKFKRIKDNLLVTAITDGLPFGMLLGASVAQSVLTSSDQPPTRLSNPLASLSGRIRGIALARYPALVQAVF